MLEYLVLHYSVDGANGVFVKINDINHTGKLEPVAKVARSSRRARETDALRGWGIWHILNIKEHFLTWIITYFH